MARTHARIYLRIWADPDFRALSPDAKLTYLEIITQPDLSWCGVIGHNPARWPAFIGWDITRSETATKELEDADFVLVDPRVHELWVKGYIKHDGILEQGKVKLAMHAAIERVISQQLQDKINAQVEELEALAKPSRCPPEGEGEFRGEGKGRGEGTGVSTGTGTTSDVSRRLIAQSDEQFERFWTAGLQKVDKQHSRNAWNARLAEKVDPEDLIVAVENYVAYQRAKGKDDPEFWKRPKTFLGPNKVWSEWLDPKFLQERELEVDSPLVRTLRSAQRLSQEPE